MVVLIKEQIRFSDIIVINNLSHETIRTLRAIIEREVKPGREIRLQQLTTQTRTKTIKAKGCISVEKLMALDNLNKLIVLNNWSSAEDRNARGRDPERDKLQQKSASLFLGREKSIYGFLIP